MDTIIMNSKDIKTSDTRPLLRNLSDKMNFKWSDKYLALLNPCIYYTWKDIWKKSCKNNKCKKSVPR